MKENSTAGTGLPARARAAVSAIPPPLLGALLFLAACSLPWVGLWERGRSGEEVLRRYGEAILHGHLPYRDFFVEYPPGALPALATPALAGRHYFAAAELQQALLGAGAVALLAATLVRSGLPRRRVFALTASAAIAPALLGPVTLNEYDWWPAFLVSAALFALVAGRTWPSFALLGVAIAAKGYPLALLGPMLAYVARRAERRAAAAALVVCAVTIAVILLPFAALAPGGLGFSTKVQLTRGLEVESLGASLLLAAKDAGMYSAHVVVGAPGSQNLSGAWPTALQVTTSLLQLAAVAAAWIVAARKQSLRAAAAAAVAAVVAFGKVISPQFLIWLIPVVPLAADAPAIGALFLALLFTQSWFSIGNRNIETLAWWSPLLVARNLTLVALFVLLFAAVLRRTLGRRPSGEKDRETERADDEEGRASHE